MATPKLKGILIGFEKTPADVQIGKKLKLKGITIGTEKTVADVQIGKKIKLKGVMVFSTDPTSINSQANILSATLR